MLKKQPLKKLDISQLLERPTVIALLLTPKLTAHCKIMRGFSDYMKANGCDWNVVLNHELKFKKNEDIDLWFDGIVADYSNVQLRNLLEPLDIPVIGLVNGIDGGKTKFRHPVVSIDNEKVMEMSHDHLVGKGHTTIAYYGLKEDDNSLWSGSRESSYKRLQSNWGRKPLIYRGQKASFSSWMEETESLRMWVDALPKPCGIIVSSDVRARTLVGVCEANDTIIPDEVSIISVGDMELSEFFHQTKLSFVDPNHVMMGNKAAELIRDIIKGKKVKSINYSTPELVSEKSSTDFRSVRDPSVLRAMHYVRLNACKGIKVQQVVDYVNCSRTLLEYKFKSQIGHSIHHEIHTLKLEQAKRILLETDMPVKEVAIRSGYPSLQYLYGLFQKELGVTPSEFREREKSKAT